MKKIFVVALISLGLLMFIAPTGRTQIESYYSGDAIYYNGQIVIGSTNTEDIEIFLAHNDDAIERVASIKPLNGQFGQEVNFSALKFSEEAGRLYVYATANYSIYKYDVSNPAYPVLVKQERNTYWEWYNGINKAGNEVISISNNKVGIFNTALQKINAYNYNTGNAYNLSFDDAGMYIIDNNDNYIQVYDRATRNVKANWIVNYQHDNVDGNHRAYGDPLNNELFVIDDYFVKKFDMEGNLKNSFCHLDYPGYDVVPSGDNKSIYVSNGIGVMKFNRDTLELSDYRFTSSLVDLGGWAMGLRVVWTPQGEKLVVFNNSNILVFDSSLNNYTYFLSTAESSQPQITENLFLNLDRNWGSSNDQITLMGGGYAANENLEIDFAGTTTDIQANSAGRFISTLLVPSLDDGWANITVVGQESSLSYSINFEVK